MISQLSFVLFAMKNLNLLTYNLFSIHLLEEVKHSYIIEIMFARTGVKCDESIKFCRRMGAITPLGR